MITADRKSRIEEMTTEQRELNVNTERDTSKPAEAQGVFRKFEVRRVDGSDQPGGKHEDCRYFVLDLDHDRHAAAAIRAYARACKETHPVLSAELEVEYPPIQSVMLTDEDLFQGIEVAGIPVEDVAMACAIKDLVLALVRSQSSKSGDWT